MTQKYYFLSGWKKNWISKTKGEFRIVYKVLFFSDEEQE